MLSRFFIDRPIFATVLAVLMIIVGVVTVRTLPIAQFPDITPPTVSVSCSYPGADAKTVAETVGVPIEEQVNGVEGMMYMSSNSSSDGSYNLTITFETGTDLDIATVKVQNRVDMAEALLPAAVKQQGVSVSSKSTNIILFVALESDNPSDSALYLTNYAKLHMVDALSRLDGVGGVSAFGSGAYSMRVWLDPDLMRIRGVSPEEVIAAIESQNVAVSAGSVGASPAPANTAFEYTLSAQGRLQTAEDFGNIVIKTSATDSRSMLRLRDVAHIDLGSQSYGVESHVNGTQSALLAIYQLPGANALDVSKNVKAELDYLSQYFPDGVHYNIILDTTQFVTASIDEVLVTFVETTLIVMIVIMFFLQNARAVVIPMLTIPVSLIATFAVMKILGFTINTLTLFGLVLAIAIVVDDAIVVVEDCQRILDEGKLSPRQAALKAMRELQGPVIGEVLVLLSVFVPTAFISGITGELYKQFALTIAVSTAFSGFNALTFTPAMCALFLRRNMTGVGVQKKPKFFLWRWFDAVYNPTLKAYVGMIGHMLRKPVVAIEVYVIICLIAFWGFVKTPQTYVPQEDMGYFMTSVQLPTGASLARTDSVVKQVEREFLTLPQVQDVIGMSGFSFMAGGNGSNYGTLFVMLKPWSERKTAENSVFSVIDKCNEITSRIQEAVIFSVDPPAIPGLGLTAGLQMELLDINNLGASELGNALQQIRDAAEKNTKIGGITSLYEGEVPQYSLNIDRDRVELLGLNLGTVFSTLSQYMGVTYVNDFVEFGRVYQVNLTGSASSRADIEDVQRLTVFNDKGQPVPFTAFTTIEPIMGQSSVNRYNMYQSASITASTAQGVSSSEGIKEMEQLVKSVTGNNFGYAWTGEAYQETQAGTTVVIVLIFAVILTILVLAAQYESWTDPLAVVAIMPTAILGTIIGCFIMNQDVSIYTQIGIVLLLGLSAKNAILIVEYAIDYRKSGVSVRQAAMDAGRVRFRPIMMTALAFVLGVMPMLFATGAGAASRLSLGAAVVFGMAVNAIIGTLFVPNFWELMQKFKEKYLDNLFTGADMAGIDNNETAVDNKVTTEDSSDEDI